MNTNKLSKSLKERHIKNLEFRLKSLREEALVIHKNKITKMRFKSSS